MGLDIWNPWHGCHKISAGCQNCYMYAMDAYRGRPEWSGQVFRTGKFKLPLKKNRDKTFKIQPGQRIRVNMTSDTFIEEAEPWLPEFWDIIRARPDVIFWILTKRPERILRSLPPDWGDGYHNVSLNITAENQEAFSERWPVFADVPARHKGICCAPLLGVIDMEDALGSGQIEEVLAGGENYENPRYCDFEWVKYLAEQCRYFKTNFCWYESGTRFWYGGRMHVYPKKADQAAIAYFSNVNQKYYDPTYRMFDPKDGHLLEPGELYSSRKYYNADHCTFCANRMLCNGCLSCGDCCGPILPVNLKDLWKIENHLIKNNAPNVLSIFRQM